MNDTHTPGPWTVNDTGRQIVDADGFQVAYTAAARQNPADAGLIAAAPDMLAALRGMLAAYDAAETIGGPEMAAAAAATARAVLKAAGLGA